MQRRLRAGDRIDGRYRIIGRLGDGASAEVFSARDLKDKRVVAVKIQLSRTFEGPATFKSYGSDIKHDFDTLENLSAVDGIPRVYDLGFHEERQYAVYELIPGQTLEDFSLHFRPLDPMPTACTIDQLAKILGDIHQLGYVHRDVKSENAMIQPDGRIRLLDLGLAIPLEGASSDDDDSAQPRGTSGYSAPEQYDRHILLTPQADIYALGCIAFEISVMQLPYADYSGRPDERIDPFPNRSVLENLPDGLRALTLEMIAEDPKRRPASMASVRERLRSLSLIPSPGAAADPKAPDPDPTQPYRRSPDASVTPPCRSDR